MVQIDGLETELVRLNEGFQRSHEDATLKDDVDQGVKPSIVLGTCSDPDAHAFARLDGKWELARGTLNACFDIGRARKHICYYQIRLASTSLVSDPDRLHVRLEQGDGLANKNFTRRDLDRVFKISCVFGLHGQILYLLRFNSTGKFLDVGAVVVREEHLSKLIFRC